MAAVPDLYLLHFEPRHEHAQHYLGYSKGNGRGRKYASEIARCEAVPPHPLITAAWYAGVTITVARIFPGMNKDDQFRIRSAGSLSRVCPVCRERGDYHR